MRMTQLLASQLQERLDRWLLFAPCLGITVTLDDGKYGRWQGASGYAEVESLTPMLVNGRCYIYSITKTFTAVRVLQLVTQGYVDLDAPVIDYLSDLDLPPTVTIRRLLNHTSGIPNYTDLPDYSLAVADTPSRPWSYEAVVARTITGTLDFTPGERWRYSNTGYMLLVQLIERVTGNSYADNIEQHIARPLGLIETYVAQGVDNGRVLPGYDRFLNSELRMENITLYYHPWWCLTGLIVSTTADITRFYLSLMQETLLLTRAMQVAMQTPIAVGSTDSFFNAPSYGLGLMIDPQWGHGGLWGHGGSGPGFNSWAMYLPSFYGRPLALTIFCNTSMMAHPFYLVRGLLAVMREGA